MPKANREFAFMTIGHRVRPSGRLWNPAADVYRGGDGWLVKVDLAGVCTDEITLELSGSVLTIRGCRRDTICHQGFTYHQMEITYSRFEKSIQFPCSLENSSLTHEYRDGLLIIRVQCQ